MSSPTQGLWGGWEVEAGRPGQVGKVDGLVTGQFLGPGHQVGRVARLLCGLNHVAWPCGTVLRPGPHVESVGIYVRVAADIAVLESWSQTWCDCNTQQQVRYKISDCRDR